MLKKILLILTLISCSQANNNGPTVVNDDPPGPPTVHNDCTEWEAGGSSLIEPQFIGHFDIPDRYFVCGETSFAEQDYYWFIHQNTTNLNFSLDSEPGTVCIVNVWSAIIVQNEEGTNVVFNLLYTFFGLPGTLQVLNFPIPETNYGFIIGITSPSDITEYQLEIWPF